MAYKIYDFLQQSIDLTMLPISDCDYKNFVKKMEDDFSFTISQSQKVLESFLRHLQNSSGSWTNFTKEIHWEETSKLFPNAQAFSMKIDLHSNYETNEQQNSSSHSEFKRIIAEFNDSESMIKSSHQFQVLYRKISGQFQGTISFLNDYFIFEGIQIADGNAGRISPNIINRKRITISHSVVNFIFTRRYIHENNSCEIFTSQKKTYLFTFNTETERNRFFEQFKGKGKCFFT